MNITQYRATIEISIEIVWQIELVCYDAYRHTKLWISYGTLELSIDKPHA
jgi:hypothetical protein